MKTFIAGGALYLMFFYKNTDHLDNRKAALEMNVHKQCKTATL